MGCRVLCHTAQRLGILVQDLDLVIPDIQKIQVAPCLFDNTIVIRIQATALDHSDLISGGLRIFFLSCFLLRSGLPAG